MKKLILVFICYSNFAMASWLCTEEASQIVNDQVFACGVATGKDENEARSKAFENAKAEYNRLCNASSECQGRAVTVSPKRTECNDNKCYRLVVFTIDKSKAIKSSSDNGQVTAKMPAIVWPGDKQKCDADCELKESQLKANKESEEGMKSLSGYTVSPKAIENYKKAHQEKPQFDPNQPYAAVPQD